jgi:hypothetical protein
MPYFMDHEIPSPCSFHIVTEPNSELVKSTISKSILRPALIFSPTHV